jgi:TP901-1 family phage major tail protein
MSAKGGKNLLLKIESSASSGTYNTMGGLRTKTMSINNGAIDVTNHGSNEWKEILDGAGIRDFQISGAGVFTSDASLDQMITDCMAGTLRNFQIVDGDSGKTYSGKFKITKVDRGGEYNGEMTWQISLQSSGEITVS